MKKINEKLLTDAVDDTTTASTSNLSSNRLQRSLTSSYITHSSNSLTKNKDFSRKNTTKNTEEKLFPSLNFLSANSKIDEEEERDYQDSPFIHNRNINFKNQWVKTQESESSKIKISKPKLKKMHSFMANHFGKDTLDVSKDSKSGLKPKLNISKKKLAIGLKKTKMKFKAFCQTMKGFNPIKDKPNQDRSLIHSFKIKDNKIRVYAVADGHGNLTKNLNFF